MKQLLVLGAGLVSPPLIRYFLSQREVRLAVASLDFSRVEALVSGHLDRVRLVPADVGDEAVVRQLVREADAVVSLLPAPLLPAISRIAVEERRHLVSTSYAAEPVRALDEEARAAGVLLLNETGFDPGIDHMTAIQTIRRIESEGGTVTGFQSAAAGLPAPEADDNPWRYKFSWSPRGAIRSAQADARFLRDGEIVAVPGRELARHTAPYTIEGLTGLEIYPNRDSLPYRELYGLRSPANLFRGTLRYPGWTRTIAAAAALGWLDESVRSWPAGTTYRQISGQRVEEIDAESMERLRWAGFLSDEPIEPTTASPLDLFVGRLEGLLRYEPGQRDMALLQHRFEISYPESRRATVVSTLVAFGEPWGDTAMSRLVALPAAAAANLILQKRISLSGVHIPVRPEFYDPILAELGEQGISVEERQEA